MHMSKNTMSKSAMTHLFLINLRMIGGKIEIELTQNVVESFDMRGRSDKVG